MFVYGVIVYAQKKLHRYWPWKTVSSHFHMLVRPMLLHRMALVSVRLFCKNLGNLQEFFGQMVYCPPPWEKIARTPMFSTEFWLQWSQILRSSGALGIVNLPVSIFKLWFPILNLEATRLCSGFRIWLMNSEWFVSFSPRFYGQPFLAPWWP